MLWVPLKSCQSSYGYINLGIYPQKYDKNLKNYIFCENFLKFVKSIKNYENSLKKSKNQDFDDFQYQPPLNVKQEE